MDHLDDALIRKLIETEFNSASRLKRSRRTKQEIHQLHKAMVAIIGEQQPMTLRQLFYALVVRGLIEKTENEYEAVGIQLLRLRRQGIVPWAAIANNTRWVRRTRTYRNLQHALEATAEFYRRDLWTDADTRVEFWCEKDALAGVLSDITNVYDVPLYVSRGFASDSYLYQAAESIIADGRPCFVYEFGDHDPSGVIASAATQRKLAEFVDDRVEIQFERAAVTEAQIRHLNLPTRPTKRAGNSHAKGFIGDSVELDAIPSSELRGIARDLIERFIDRERLQALEAAEASEREILRAFAAKHGGRA